MHHGIRSLPEELLANIIEMACFDSCDRDKDFENLRAYGPVPQRFGSVCRRFRAITFQLPELWCDIRITRSLEWTQTQLERSKYSTLDITISTITIMRRFEVDTFNQFWALISRHCHRWGSFTLQFFRRDVMSAPRCMDLVLPRLETLDILRRPVEIMKSSTMAIKSWTMPLLTRLRCNYDLIDAPFTCPLECLVLNISLDQACRRYGILEFLGSPIGKDLVDLTIDHRYDGSRVAVLYHDWNEAEQDARGFPSSVRLDRLQQLLISTPVLALCRTSRAIGVLTEYLVAPNLEKVSFIFDVNVGYYDLKSWFRWIRKQKNEQLVKVDVMVRGKWTTYADRDELYHLGAYLKSKPKFETFEVVDDTVDFDDMEDLE